MLVKGTGVKAVWPASDQNRNTSTAVVVEYVDASNQTYTLASNQEVIISAGSLRTPLFLELSGIGNPDLLKKHKIPVMVSLPSVGENLQNQSSVNLVYFGTLNITGYAPYAVFATAQDLFGDDTSAVASSTRERIPIWAKNISDASGGTVKAPALETIYGIQHDLIFNQNVTIAGDSPHGKRLHCSGCVLGAAPVQQRKRPPLKSKRKQRASN